MNQAAACVTDPLSFLLVATNILQALTLILQSFTHILQSPKKSESLVLRRWKVRAPYNKLVLPESLGFTVPEDNVAHLLHKRIFLWNQGSAFNERAATVLIIFGIYIPPLIPKLPRTTNRYVHSTLHNSSSKGHFGFSHQNKSDFFMKSTRDQECSLSPLP